MVQLNDGLAALSLDDLSLYHTTDPQLSKFPLILFYGASTTANSTLNSSRIQVHILSAAGFQSYPRLTISPNSPFYTAVDQLPQEWQGDEVCRGLAFGLLKYFRDLPEVVKTTLIVQSSNARGKKGGAAPPLFGEQHAASLASSMVRVENIKEVTREISIALQPQSITYIDVDLVLPPGSIVPQNDEQEKCGDDDSSFDPSLHQYGVYASLVKLFGPTVFLPTSKVRRAPSKPTSLNRSTSLQNEQKMSLRREMKEFVDTEERYVTKMRELVLHLAQDFRQKAKTRAFGSTSPSEQDLKRLFPGSLDKILEVNSSFLKDIQEVMEDTEQEATRDLEAVQMNNFSNYNGTGQSKDPTGTFAFAKVLLEWFPRFSECYQEYIRASQDFPQIITSFVKLQSSFSQRIQQTGEQRLRSAVIEPVQRLPRYSLFIDNIVNYLPMSHPAIKQMIKARDIITAICSLDPPNFNKSQVIDRLRALIGYWPSNLLPQGRLITAVDFIELSAPYDALANSSPSNAGILLLFAESVIILRKTVGCNLSARGVIAEVDKPSVASMMTSATATSGGQRSFYELNFESSYLLNETRFTESCAGRVTWMTCPNTRKDNVPLMDRTSFTNSMRGFLLQGAYDCKASKWTEEVIKARVEGRFSEGERETEKWCLRSVNLNSCNLNLYTAVFEEGIDSLIPGRREPAPVRIVIDHIKGTKGAPVGHYGIEVVANIIVGESVSNSTHRLQIDGLNDKVFIDAVDATTFMPVFAKRVSDLLRTQHVIGNQALTSAFISHYVSILKSLHFQLEGENIKSYRPPSPVKMLSSFLNGGGSFSSAGNPTKQPQTPQLGIIPSMPPPSRSENQRRIDAASQDKGIFRRAIDETRPTNPLLRLEETLNGYIAALQSRKGTVVGKLLRTRAAADELSVNALYNAFIENPFDTRTSSEVSIDVLFTAFEKFLRIAWREQIGPVVTLSTLRSLQEKSAKLFPGDFADFIKVIFSDIAPQNGRAFVAIVKLLADLLEGCTNDADRGSLTVTFAELLVTEGDPHNFINLLDRLVEDIDRLFEDLSPGSSSGYGTPAYGSVSSTTRSTWSTNTGSLTSNSSSIRKRFGFDTLLRQNSKTEADSRPSVWRTLSKTTRAAATGEPTSSSLSKVSLSRSRSIDTTRVETPQKRGVSHERPTVLGAFDERPSSSHVQTPSRLSTIGASPPADEVTPAKSLRNKRRSSLSDLKKLLESTNLGSPSPATYVRQLPSPERFNSSPRTPSPTKSSLSHPISYITAPSQQNQNAMLLSRETGNLTAPSGNVVSVDTVTVKDLWSAKNHTKHNSISSIPTANGKPRDGTPTGSPNKSISNPQKGSPQKLRLQSPQKLRERLQNEAKAIDAAEASLKSELSKIGEEMAKLSGPRTSQTVSVEIQKLSNAVKDVELKIPSMIQDLISRNETVKQDLEMSLQTSENKVKGLIQLNKEISAENELLYEKFNGELGKIVKALKGKGKEDKEELVLKTREATEEAARWKKENGKLRREILTLKSMLTTNEA